MDFLFSIMFFVFAIIIFIVVFNLVRINAQLKKSTYGEVSGNSLMKIAFDKGVGGEFYTYRLLEKCGEKNILCNIYLPKLRGGTTEVDLASVNTKGIFVYESKNYSGWIYGSEENRYWTQVIKGGKKSKFYNPIIQNKGHIKAMDNFLDKKYTDKFMSYIVFSERCELKKVEYSGDNLRVINRYRLKKTFLKDMGEMPDVLSAEEVKSIYQELKSKTLVSDEVKKQHIESIKSKASN